MSTSERQPSAGKHAADRLLFGIFVGGKSSRMGQPKGLLPSPGGGEMLVERAFRVAAEALPGASRWLVGNQSAYRHLSFHELCDQVPESGPLSGLSSLLRQAQREGCTGAIALACDMPYFQAPLLRRLCDEQPDAAVLVPVVDDRFQPLFGRYSVGVLPQVERALRDRRLALQPLLRELSATCLPLNASEIAELRDWDRPQDIVPP